MISIIQLIIIFIHAIGNIGMGEDFGFGLRVGFGFRGGTRRKCFHDGRLFLLGIY